MTNNYDAALLEHNLHPSHRGILSANPSSSTNPSKKPLSFPPKNASATSENSKILSATHKNESCGDEITIFLKTKNGKLLDASWEGSGCALAKASADILCSSLLGNSSNNKIIQRTREKLPGRTKCLDTPLLALTHLLKTSPELASILKPPKTNRG